MLNLTNGGRTTYNSHVSKPSAPHSGQRIGNQPINNSKDENPYRDIDENHVMCSFCSRQFKKDQLFAHIRICVRSVDDEESSKSKKETKKKLISGESC